MSQHVAGKLSAGVLRRYDPRIRKMIKRATEQGWMVTMTAQMHCRLRAPDGCSDVFTSGNGKAYRTTLNRMKALGYVDA